MASPDVVAWEYGHRDCVIGRGTSVAAACSLGEEEACSDPQTRSPHPQSHTAIYGFFFAASFALIAAPAPPARTRAYAHTQVHTHTKTPFRR